eukprot:8292296-Pyramimonas_sp.AAC.1
MLPPPPPKEGLPTEVPREELSKKAPSPLYAMAPPPATKPNVASLEGVPQAKQTVPKKAPPPPQYSPEACSMDPQPARVPRVDRGGENLL